MVLDLAFSKDGSRVVIYAASPEELPDVIWVVNVSSSKVEASTDAPQWKQLHGRGRAQLSPDTGVYLARSYIIPITHHPAP
jgi:hypothetical protein